MICANCKNNISSEALFCPKCGARLTNVFQHQLAAGFLLRGRYVILRTLGEGGFGITYLANDTLLGMPVAVKEYFPNGMATRTGGQTVEASQAAALDGRYISWKEKFIQEARILAKFSQEPGIVSVRDFFEDNNTAYIVMEFLEGETLKSMLEKAQRLSDIATVELFKPVMKSLDVVHMSGLIHRDISPDNIMITRGGAKLLDFGAARAMTSENNKSISVMLKTGYSPEEQYRKNGQQGPWTDVYALSATMYKCITGIVPDDPVQRLLGDTLKAPSDLGIPISQVIESAIIKGLSIRKEDRFQTISEFMGALGISSASRQTSNHTHTSFTRAAGFESATGTSTSAEFESAGNVKTTAAFENTGAFYSGTNTSDASTTAAFGNVNSSYKNTSFANNNVNKDDFRTTLGNDTYGSSDGFNASLFWQGRLERIVPVAAKMNGLRLNVCYMPNVSPILLEKVSKNIVKNQVDQSNIVGFVTLAMDKKPAYPNDKSAFVVCRDRIIFSTGIDAAYGMGGIIGIAIGSSKAKKVPTKMTLFYEDMVSASCNGSTISIKLRDNTVKLVDITSSYNAEEISKSLNELSNYKLYLNTNGQIRSVI